MGVRRWTHFSNMIKAILAVPFSGLLLMPWQNLRLIQRLTDMDTGEDMVDTEVAMEAIDVMEDITVERGTLRLIQMLMLHQKLTDMDMVMEDITMERGKLKLLQKLMLPQKLMLHQM